MDLEPRRDLKNEKVDELREMVMERDSGVNGEGVREEGFGPSECEISW